MKIVSAVGGTVVLEHVGREGSQKIPVLVDNDSKKFIKENISKINFDKTNNVLKYNGDESTTLARAFIATKNSIPIEKNVHFKDGNKFNLKTKNLYIKM